MNCPTCDSVELLENTYTGTFHRRNDNFSVTVPNLERYECHECRESVMVPAQIRANFKKIDDARAAVIKEMK